MNVLVRPVQKVFRHGSIGFTGVLGRETDVIPKDEADLPPTQSTLFLFICKRVGRRGGERMT